MLCRWVSCYPTPLKQCQKSFLSSFLVFIVTKWSIKWIQAGMENQKHHHQGQLQEFVFYFHWFHIPSTYSIGVEKILCFLCYRQQRRQDNFNLKLFIPRYGCICGPCGLSYFNTSKIEDEFSSTGEAWASSWEKVKGILVWWHMGLVLTRIYALCI